MAGPGRLRTDERSRVHQRRMPSGQGPARGRPARLWSRMVGAPPRRPGRFAGSESPGGARPAGGLRRGQPARRTRAPRGPIRITGRTAALGVVLLALVVSYAYPLRVYFAQQAEIAALEAGQREQRERIQRLADEVARWNDDEYVKGQALQRLRLAEVGEMVYVVGVDISPGDAAGEAMTPPPWYEQVWTSVQTADDPPTP